MDQEDHFPINSLGYTNAFDIAIRMNNPSDFTWEDNIVLDSDEKELLLMESKLDTPKQNFSLKKL